MKNFVAKLIAYWVMFLVLFAVFFDPTEMGLGNQFVTLPGWALTTAEVVGNATWLAGILYLFIAFGSLMCLFSDKIYTEAYKAEKAKDTDFAKAVARQAKRKRWFELPKWLLFLSLAIIALGSGFWFTGSAWVSSLILTRALLHKMRDDEDLKGELL